MTNYVSRFGLAAVMTLAPLSLVAQTAPPKAAPKPAAPAAAAPTKPPAAPAAASTNDAADPVVLTVGPDKITKSQFQAIFDQVTSQLPPERRAAAQSPDAKKQMAQQLAELKALAQEARREKLDQTPDAKTQLTMRADQFAASLLYQQIAKNSKPSDAEIKAYYDAHKDEYETLTARHILIRMKDSQVPLKAGEKDLTDEEAMAKAKDLHDKIVAGGNFEELAKAESDDAGSGANGGALGEFTRGRMVPQFEEAAFKLKVNDVSEPVKTQFGYHIIQVTKRESKSLADVKPEIEKKLEPEATQKGVDAIREKATITFNESYFGK